MMNANSDVPAPLQNDNLTTEVLRKDIWAPANRHNDWSMFVIVGREGSGKSLTCASILHACDPGFTVGNAHFRAVPFLDDLGSEKDQPGRAAMLDEAGVAFGNRTWHDREQKKANQYLQTARDDNRIVGLTLPRLEELDSQLRGRIHYLGKAVKMKKGEWVELMWKRVNPTREGEGDIFREYPRANFNGRTSRIERIRIAPPPEEFLEGYEAKKAEFKDETKAEVIDLYSDDEEPDTLSEPKEIVDHIVETESWDEYIGNNNGQTYLDKDMIAYEYGIGDRKAKKVKKGLQKEVDEL
jgi:hypothetical protein